MPLLVIAAALLFVAILLVLIQPMNNDTQTASSTTAPQPPLELVDRRPMIEASTPAPSPAVTTPAPSPEVVTRAQTPLLGVPFTPVERFTSVSINEQLRQPIRVISSGPPKRDLPTLTRDILDRLTPGALHADGSAMVGLLVDAIHQRQSDEYINVLLNTAADRGAVTTPPALRMADGGLDAYALLRALALMAGPQGSTDQGQITGALQHTVAPNDSLAGLALRHYGQPLNYDVIMSANPQIDPVQPQLVAGNVIRIPAP